MKRTALVVGLLILLLWLPAGSCAYSRWRDGERIQEAVVWEAHAVNLAVGGEELPTSPDPWGTPYAVFRLEGEKYEPEAFTWGGQTVRPAGGVSPYPLVVQVISAGPDRVFGTEDDIRSWDRFPPE